MSSLSLRGMLVMPVRRGVPVTPAEPEWIIKRYSADPTSGSLREKPQGRIAVRPRDLFVPFSGGSLGNLPGRCRFPEHR